MKFRSSGTGPVQAKKEGVYPYFFPREEDPAFVSWTTKIQDFGEMRVLSVRYITTSP